MLASHIYIILLWSCLLGLVRSAAKDDAEEFKQIRQEIFGEDSLTSYKYHIEGKIDRLIKLAESGTVPTEVQGKQTGSYLRSLTDDCSVGAACDLDKDLLKLERLSNRRTKAVNLDSYLDLCMTKIQEKCASEAYKRVKSSLKLQEQTSEAVDALALEVYRAFSSVDFSHRFRVDDIFKGDLHASVLMAVRRLDPDRAKKVAKKWVAKGHQLSTLLDIIRSSCVTFLEQIDKVVELWPAWHSGTLSSEPTSALKRLHYSLKSCRNVVADWKEIISKSRYSYDEYLL